MKLITIWGLRESRYEGEYAPELLDAWDEQAVLENPSGYKEALNKAQYQGCKLVRELVIEVPTEAVDDLFRVPEVQATVEKT